MSAFSTVSECPSVKLRSRFLAPSETSLWNSFVLSHGGHVFQTVEWGHLSRRLGWEPHHLVCEDEAGTWQAVAMVLCRSRLMGHWIMGYVPRGPVVLDGRPQKWTEVLRALSTFARDMGALVVRVNPLGSLDEKGPEVLMRGGWERAATREMHVRTFRLLLGPDEKTLWDGLEHRTRKAIKKAQRAGIEVTKEFKPESIEEFLTLYEDNARRLNIAFHARDFIREVWRNFSDKGWVHLFLARRRGAAVSGLFLFQYGHTMEEMWIGWDAQAKEDRPNQLLHWEVLRWCQQNGVLVYDFGGVPPEEDGTHGVTFYKSGFGAQRVDLIGEYDYFPSRLGKLIWKKLRPIVRNTGT